MQRVETTVAIATMSRPGALARCVAAVLAGTTRPSEIVIVDQSQDDETAQLVRAADWARAGHVDVRYVRQPQRGLAASRNAAIAASTQPIIAFTDDDCVPDREWLAAVAAAFGNGVDAVTGRIAPLGADEPGMWAVSTRASRIRTTYRARSLPWTVGSGGNTAVRREWLTRVGGFDERLGAGAAGRAAEDLDCLYRLLSAGATVQYEPQAVVFHQRKNHEGWLATRTAYGFGLGAFCGLRLRAHDGYAAWMLTRWCAERAVSLARACAKCRWSRAGGELRMLHGAASGLAHGLDARMDAPAASPAWELTVECNR